MFKTIKINTYTGVTNDNIIISIPDTYNIISSGCYNDNCYIITTEYKPYMDLFFIYESPYILLVIFIFLTIFSSFFFVKNILFVKKNKKWEK